MFQFYEDSIRLLPMIKGVKNTMGQHRILSKRLHF